MKNKSSGGARRGAGRPKLPPELNSKRKHYNWYVTEEERTFLLNIEKITNIDLELNGAGFFCFRR